MTRQQTLCFLAVFCVLALVLGCLNEIETAICEDDVQLDRTYSFVTEALQLHGASGGNQGGYAWVSFSNATNKWITEWAYTYASGGADVSVFAEYMAEGKGLYFVTIETAQSSSALPLCAQPMAKALDRAKDFLGRYQNWTSDSNLTKIVSTLNVVDASQNGSVVFDDLNLTVSSNMYATDFYWGYINNGTYSRGLGITFVSNHVFFRDDRNLLLPPREPPANIFTSSSPYISKWEEPNTPPTRSVNESFEFMTPRPASIMELYLNPKANFAPVVTEVRMYSGYFTFNFQEPLQPNKLYTATLLCGQGAPADIDEAPVILLSWSFITENTTQKTEPSNQTLQATPSSNSQTPDISPSSTIAQTSPQLEISYPSPFSVEIIFALIVGVAAIAITIIAIVLKKRTFSSTIHA